MTAIQKLNNQIQQIAALKTKERFGHDFKRWQRNAEVMIEYIFGKGAHHLKDFNNVC